MTKLIAGVARLTDHTVHTIRGVSLSNATEPCTTPALQANVHARSPEAWLLLPNFLGLANVRKVISQLCFDTGFCLPGSHISYSFSIGILGRSIIIHYSKLKIQPQWEGAQTFMTSRKALPRRKIQHIWSWGHWTLTCARSSVRCTPRLHLVSFGGSMLRHDRELEFL